MQRQKTFKRLNSLNLSPRMEFAMEIENSELLSFALEISACINFLLCAFLNQVFYQEIIVQGIE